MVTFTNTPTEVYGAGNVAKSEVVTLLGEIAAAVDASTVSPVAESGSNVTVTAGDGGRLFIQTAASIVSLPEISSVPNGFYILVKADTGTTTIDPDGSETIEGATTLALVVSEAARITSDGSEWRTIITRGLGTLGTAALMADSGVANLAVDPLAAARRGLVASAIALTKSYASSGQTIIPGGLLTLAHGMGSEPKILQYIIQCITAEHGYSVGDRINVSSFTASDTIPRPTSVFINATNIQIRFFAGAAFQISDKSTGTNQAISNNRWELYVRAFA